MKLGPIMFLTSFHASSWLRDREDTARMEPPPRVARPAGPAGMGRKVTGQREGMTEIDVVGIGFLREDAAQRQVAADRLLDTMSWDRTWEAMCDRIRERVEYRAVRARRVRPTLPTSPATPDTGALPLLPRWANLS